MLPTFKTQFCRLFSKKAVEDPRRFCFYIFCWLKKKNGFLWASTWSLGVGKKSQTGSQVWQIWWVLKHSLRTTYSQIGRAHSLTASTDSESVTQTCDWSNWPLSTCLQVTHISLLHPRHLNLAMLVFDIYNPPQFSCKRNTVADKCSWELQNIYAETREHFTEYRKYNWEKKVFRSIVRGWVLVSFYYYLRASQVVNTVSFLVGVVTSAPSRDCV